MNFYPLKCKHSSLRSQCWMRLFQWFSNTVVDMYYFSNVASNKILLSFLMTIEVWKDDCLTFAWCFCIAWRTGSWCTEITRGGEGPNQQHSNNFIFRSIISFPLGIWFNLLKAAIASCQEPKWNCILECTTWCKNINFHAKNFLFEKWKFD